MNRWLLCGVVAVASAASLPLASKARALMIAPPPGPTRVVQADGIIVGRVVAHEPKDIQLSPAPGADNKITYRVAVINVTEVVKGMEKVKSVRVGFIPQGDQPIRPGRPGMRGGPQLTMGTEGMFFLTKHHSEKDFWTVQNFYDVVAKGENNANFDTEVKEAKRVIKLLENPMESLKSKNADDRFQTAALLVAQYKNFRNAGGKTEQIPAEESKLILKGLLEGNWNAQGGRFGQMDSWQVFNQLQLTEKEGWKVPQNVNNITQFHDAAKEWLKKNGDTYRIERFVPGTAKNNGGNPDVKPGVRPLPPIQIQPVPGGIQIQPLPGQIQIQPGVIQPGVIRILPAPLPPVRE